MAVTHPTSTPSPVEIASWKCNGSINPLIRSVEQLRIVAGPEFREACRYCAIHLDCIAKMPEFAGYNWPAKSDEFCEHAARTYFAYRAVPYWQRSAEILPGIRTPAQFLAKHGNLDCRAKCCDVEDLCRAVELMGSYNEFNDDRFISLARRFDLLRYYGPDNPNTGNSLFDYSYGWENSHVVYIRFICSYEPKALGTDWKTWRPFDSAEFQRRCEFFGRQSRADENDCVDADETCVTWRLWWD